MYRLSLMLLAAGKVWAQYNQQAALSVTDSAAAFGGAVALSADGNTALVGGANAGLYSGVAWIFTRSGTTWTQQAKLTATDSAGAAEQGYAVALSADGNTAVVGGPFDNGSAGAAWVFTRGSGTWAQVGAKLVGTGAAGPASQGRSVAVSGDGNTVLIGGPTDNGNAGAFWVFTQSGGIWTQAGSKLSGTGASGAAQQGAAVAISADASSAAVGGPADNNGAGAVWFFAWSGGAWTQQGTKVTGNNGAGTAVAMSADGGTAVAGQTGTNSGTALVIARVNGFWTQTVPLMSPSTDAASVGVSSDGTVVVVGGPLDSSGAPGQQWIFTKSKTAWSQVSTNPIYLGSTAAVSGDGRTLIAGGPATNNGNGNAVVFVSPPPPDIPAANSSTPAAGTGSSAAFTFTFSDPLGFNSLTVLNVLVATALDGRRACYLAFSPASGTLSLVDDAGDAAGPYATLTLPGSGLVQNSQCIVSGAGSSFSGSGNTLTLTLAMTFSPGFTGNKVIRLAARSATGNSGWGAYGTWNIPGLPPVGPSVSGMTPASGAATPTYTFNFSDTNGWQDIGVANVLINGAIDGRRGCYLAFVSSSANGGTVYLVDDAGDAGGPYASLVLPGTGTATNSQCTVSGTGSAVNGAANSLGLTLAITLSHAFAGNQLFFLAARNNTQNSGWQAVGSVTVP